MADSPFQVGDELVFNYDEELVAPAWVGVPVTVTAIDRGMDAMTVTFNHIPPQFRNHMTVGDTGDYPLVHATRYFRKPVKPPKFTSVEEAKQWMDGLEEGAQ